MDKEEFDTWCEVSGHLTCNDWQFQIIEDYMIYFIINPKNDTFSLIKQNIYTSSYEILVEGYKDYNGWVDKFHKETGGFYK